MLLKMLSQFVIDFERSMLGYHKLLNDKSSAEIQSYKKSFILRYYVLFIMKSIEACIVDALINGVFFLSCMLSVDKISDDVSEDSNSVK